MNLNLERAIVYQEQRNFPLPTLNLLNYFYFIII